MSATSVTTVESIVNAVLYEGYMLYPYRASSVKNRQRWTFGGVYPQDYSVAHRGAEPCMIQTECLAQGGPGMLVSATPGFLHLVEREAGELPAPLPVAQAREMPDLRYRTVGELCIDGQRFYSWQEAVEERIVVEPLRIGDADPARRITGFVLPGQRTLELLPDAQGAVAGVLARTRHRLVGVVEMLVRRVGAGLFRITVRLTNRTPFPDGSASRDAATLQALVSCHIVLRMSGGRFLSSLDPPAEAAPAAARCENIGVWPVLAGDQDACDTMLASPIILYDFPQVAPESPGDLFDATEIDEILTLRILTMTDEEKQEMAAVDARARALLERTEKLTPQELQRLHGTLRSVRETSPAIDRLQVGDQVRLRPRGNADIFDLALAGRLATIEAIERDFDDRVHIAVTVNDDPGRDLGLARMPGRRFFFAPDEVEPVAPQRPVAPRRPAT